MPEIRSAVLTCVLGLPGLTAPLVWVGTLGGQEPVRYEFAGSELWRIDGGERVAIGCTEPGGTGAVRSVARGPHGTVYVAAERGLFALSDAVRHTTPLPLEQGAPQGALRWVGVDHYGTIWLSTDRQFGCVDPVHLVGQVHGEAPAAVEMIDRRVLRITAAGGSREYRPRSGPAPELEIARADPAPVAGVVRVRVRATAAGDPIYGWRLGRRHRFELQREPDFAITGLEPGRQDLYFAVFDRDMRMSSQVRVLVSVPYPRSYSKAVAVPGILLVTALLLGALLFRARRAGGGRQRYVKAFLSAFLAVVLGLQVLAGVVAHGRSWPFVGYSMYSEKYMPGQHTYQALIRGVDAEGRIARLDPGIAGFPSDGYWQALLPLVYGGDEPCRRFLAAYNARLPKHRELVGFVIHDHKYRLTSAGPIQVAPVVMRVFPEDLFRGRY